jgi:hypothetical protein
VKEITSAYQDLEKRMAVFAGLGAVVFVSLFNLAFGADLVTFLVRGLIALLVFSLVGYWYGRYMTGLVVKEESLPLPPESGVQVTSTEARPVDLSEASSAVDPILQQPATPAAEPEPPAQGQHFDRVLDEEAAPDLAAELTAGPGKN